MGRPFSRITLLSLLTIGVLVSIPSPANAVIYVPGVSPGNWVRYGQVSGFWNIPFQDPPQFIRDAMSTNWILAEVLAVVGNNVTAPQTWNFNNSTFQRTVLLTGNVETGSGNLTIFIVSKGLAGGVPINLMPLAPTINRTMVRNYIGADRQVSVLNATLSQVTSFGSLFVQALLFWDQSTSVLLESSFVETVSIRFGGLFVGSAHIVATETSLWQAPAPEPDFTLTANPVSLRLQAGMAGSSSITVRSINGYTGAVSFSVTVSPPGQIIIGPVDTTLVLGLGEVRSFHLTVYTTPTTDVGTHTATVIGTGGPFTSHTVTVAVLVTAPTPTSDFEITGPSSLTIVAGSSSTAQIAITRTDGFAGTVILNATFSPPGPTASLVPATISRPNAYQSSSSTLTVSVPGSASPGSYTITITGTSGPISHSIIIPLTVKAATQPPKEPSSSRTQFLFETPLILVLTLAVVVFAVLALVPTRLIARKSRPIPPS